MPSEKLHNRDKTWNHVSVVSGLEDGSDGDVETDCDRTVGRKFFPESSSPSESWTALCKST